MGRHFHSWANQPHLGCEAGEVTDVKEQEAGCRTALGRVAGEAGQLSRSAVRSDLSVLLDRIQACGQLTPLRPVFEWRLFQAAPCWCLQPMWALGLVTSVSHGALSLHWAPNLSS